MAAHRILTVIDPVEIELESPNHARMLGARRCQDQKPATWPCLRKTYPSTINAAMQQPAGAIRPRHWLN
jgi:hypothetical protein